MSGALALMATITERMMSRVKFILLKNLMIWNTDQNVETIYGIG